MLYTDLRITWMSGAILGAAFIACCFFLRFTPDVPSHHRGAGPWAAVKGVTRDLWKMVKTKSGLLSAILCFMPVGTGAAAGVLTQSAVAGYWHAGDDDVALVQGLLAAGITSAGCFVGGYACQRLEPRFAYAVFGLSLAAMAVGMGLSPHGRIDYIVWSLVYSFGVGLCYAAFTAFVLREMGGGAGATKYNIFASLANFPIWWLGLLLGWVAEKRGAPRCSWRRHCLA
jgi:hypothetical protein